MVDIRDGETFGRWLKRSIYTLEDTSIPYPERPKPQETFVQRMIDRGYGASLSKTKNWCNDTSTPSTALLVGILDVLGIKRAADRQRIMELAAQQASREEPPWTPEEDALLGTEPDAVVAGKLKRPRRSVANRRAELGVPAFVHFAWSAEEDALIGAIPDREVAAKTGRSLGSVVFRRKKLGRPAKRPSKPPLRDRPVREPRKIGPQHAWTPEEDALLGTDKDNVIAAALGVSDKQVWTRRDALGIPAYKKPPKRPNLAAHKRAAKEGS